MERLNKFSRLINKVYYNLFVELDKKKKITFNFTEEKRWDLLNQIIKIKKIENYLEIGCDNNDLFEKINVSNKIGVDPREGGNVRKTSDEFFKYNKKKFELIFIDGLHKYDQVNRDIENSLNTTIKLRRTPFFLISCSLNNTNSNTHCYYDDDNIDYDEGGEK